MPARESHHDHGGLATIYHDHNSPCDLHWYFQWKEQESENNEASPVFHTEGEGGAVGFSPSPSQSSPPCSPSSCCFCNLICGQYPHGHGVRNTIVNEKYKVGMQKVIH